MDQIMQSDNVRRVALNTIHDVVGNVFEHAIDPTEKKAQMKLAVVYGILLLEGDLQADIWSDVNA